jgi:hypothetical protein
MKRRTSFLSGIGEYVFLLTPSTTSTYRVLLFLAYSFDLMDEEDELEETEERAMPSQSHLIVQMQTHVIVFVVVQKSLPAFDSFFRCCSERVHKR